jgi:hypothetical protein
MSQEQYAAIGNRAWAIVNRLYPDTNLNPHGFLYPQAMIEVCNYRAARNRLFKRIFWRLVEKQNEPILNLTAEKLSDPLKRRAA